MPCPLGIAVIGELEAEDGTWDEAAPNVAAAVVGDTDPGTGAAV
jgi:hypothetical protein